MIQLDQVTKVFTSSSHSGVKAVNEVSFTVGEAETLCIIGTSGSGKTTCMKMINRLLEPTSGDIQVGGESISSLDPIRLRRRIGYVIQKGGLLPHLTVAKNIGLLCKLEGWTSNRIQERVSELLDLVNMPAKDYAHRYPSELSGGQQQRVGVARALALDPRYILMDEPFGALDPITREGLHEEFLRLKQEVGKTIVMVTHDLQEAFKLGDRIALMDKGKLVQIGTESDFHQEPANQFVKDFVKNHESSERARVQRAVVPGECSDQDEPLQVDDPLDKAARVFLQQDVSEWPVVDENGQRVGKVTKESVLRHLC